MTGTIQMTGTLSDGRVVTLDQPISLDAGRVRITLEVVPELLRPQTFQEVMEAIWADQRRRGHVPPTAEEVADRIREAREGWDE